MRSENRKEQQVQQGKKISGEICWQKVRNMLGAEEIVHPLPSVFFFYFVVVNIPLK